MGITNMTRCCAVYLTLALACLGPAPARAQSYGPPYGISMIHRGWGTAATLPALEKMWWDDYREYWNGSSFYGEKGPLENNCGYTKTLFEPTRENDGTVMDLVLTGFCQGGNRAYATFYPNGLPAPPLGPPLGPCENECHIMVGP